MRHHSTVQIRAPGKATGDDCAASYCLSKNVYQRVRTDAVNAAGPTLLLERRSFFLQNCSIDKAGRSQERKVVVGFWTPCRRRDIVALRRKQRDRDRANTTSRPGDNHFA